MLQPTLVANPAGLTDGCGHEFVTVRAIRGLLVLGFMGGLGHLVFTLIPTGQRLSESFFLGLPDLFPLYIIGGL